MCLVCQNYTLASRTFCSIPGLCVMPPLPTRWLLPCLYWDFTASACGGTTAHSSQIALLAEADLEIFISEMWSLSMLLLMEEGTTFPFTCGISAFLPKNGNSPAVLPAGCGRFSLVLWGQERHKAKARTMVPHVVLPSCAFPILFSVAPF